MYRYIAMGCVLSAFLAAGASALTWDFEKADQIKEWSSPNGDWSIKSGVLAVKNNGQPAQRIFVGDEKWTDYTVEAKIRIDEGNWAGVIFRAQGDFEYYVAYLNVPDNKSELWRHMKGANDTRVAINLNFPAVGGVKIGNGAWLEAKLVAEGDVFTFSLNGQKQWQTKEGTLKSGRIGVWTWTTSGSFDDVSVNGKGIPIGLSVQPIGKLTTTWAALRRR